MKTNLRYYTAIILLSAATTAPAYARTLQPAAAQQAPVFIENKGQITDQYGNRRSDIDYKLETPGMNIYIGKGQIHYQWQRSKEQATNVQPDIIRETAQPSETEIYRMDVSLVGAAQQAMPVAEEQQVYYEQYYLPQCADGAIAHSYTRITYRNIYPNIDWVVYSKKNELKYDFVVHPGGDSRQIKLRYEGATRLQLQDGALKASTPFGSITEHAPYSYTINGKEKVVSAYRLDGHTLSFKAPKDGIVIDPVLEWATYYGGTLRENERTLCSTLDDAGNAYLAGATASTNNIITVGAYLTTYTGEGGYIAKFNTSGARQWATYYPGAINAICTDAAGTVYITGHTTATTGIATSGAHQSAYAGISNIAPPYGDAFLAKFTSSGTRVWGTYFGGAGSENANAITCDPMGNVYIGGRTSSNSGIASNNAHSTTFSGQWDGFIAKFSPGSTRLWSTYYGGADQELAIALHCDSDGNVYAAGSTGSTNGIATIGAHQDAYAGPSNIHNGYLIKFNANGIRQWGTYYGNGIGLTGIMAICSDQQNNIYVGGSTESNTGIASLGSFAPSLLSLLNGFAAKFSNSGVRQWGTYYGGNLSSIVNGIACKQDGSKVYLYGQTVSTSGIATVGAFQSALGGNWDAFLGVLNGAGTAQLWGSYYGGTGHEITSGNNNIGAYMYCSAKLSFNGSKLQVAGLTNSATGISNSGHQNTIGGDYDHFLLSMAEDTSVYIIQPYIDTLFCPGDTFHLAYGVSPGFAAGNVFTVQMSDANGSFATPVTIGTRTATTAGNIIVTIPHNTPAGSGYRLRIVASAPAYTSNNNGVDIRIKAAPTVPVATSNTPVCAGQNLALDVSTPGPGIAYSWAGPGSYTATVKNPTINAAATTASGDYIVTVTLTATGCALKDTITATVGALPPAPVAGNSGPVCAGQPLQLTATGVAGTYNWTGPATIPPGQNPTIGNATTGNSGNYNVTVTTNGCTSPPAATMVTIKPIPATPVITGNSPVCLGTALQLQAAATPGSSYNWTGPNGYTSNAQNIVIDPATKAHAGGYGVIASLNGCNSLPATYLVQVNTVASTGAYASPNDTICPGATVQFVAFAQNAGTAPAFQWYRNGVPETTAPVFTTSNIAHGDRFWCSMTATGVCATPLTIVTDTIRMAVVPMTVTPSVMITALPGVHIRPGTLITFTAYMQNGGFAPKYQWKKNGVNVGVTTATWATDKLLPGDAITVELESNDHCASPKTATSAAMHIGFPLGIDGHNAKGISLYPNPNAGSFTISGIGDAGVQAEVINALGQTVYTKQHTTAGGSITLQTALPAGAYLLRLYTGSNVQVLRFSITK